jgi:hypothetical protein
VLAHAAPSLFIRRNPSTTKPQLIRSTGSLLLIPVALISLLRHADCFSRCRDGHQDIAQADRSGWPTTPCDDCGRSLSMGTCACSAGTAGRFGAADARFHRSPPGGWSGPGHARTPLGIPLQSITASRLLGAPSVKASPPTTKGNTSTKCSHPFCRSFAMVYDHRKIFRRHNERRQ